MFAGAYRLSKRQIQQVAADLFALSISTGMISKLERQSAAVLEAPYNELAPSVHQAEVVNIDETSWRENRRKVWLWATVTALFTVFTIAKNRSGEVAQALLGERRRSGRRQRPVQRLRLDRGVLATGLLEPSASRLSGDDRPGRRRRDDRHDGCSRCRTGCSATGTGCATALWSGVRFQERMRRLRREVQAGP